MFAKFVKQLLSPKIDSCNEEMAKMIDILNKLQDKLVSLGVTNLVKELPQIAVIGSQSAGKSSVLESFVGRDFLPRGQDIVTRRPLILQLKQNRDNSRTYAKFNHSPKEFTDFDEIRLEIETETDRTVPDSAISPEPINLMITSPDVLDLNLIDLPGMTKVPVGNQPENIETIVKSLINEYISKDNCLILAVTPANQDLSTSDAIKLAREVDPTGKRTIGVLTKLDLLDDVSAQNARKILVNEHKIRLRRGFIGVINRSPKDIIEKKGLREALVYERDYLAKHSAFNDIIDKLGIEYLQKYLQKELAEHLFIGLPALRDKFEDDLFNVEQKLEKIGSEMDAMTANDLISQTLENMRKYFHNEIGTGVDVPVDRTNGGANINVKMNVEYPEAIENIAHNERRIKNEIRLAIQNIFGTRLELFVPNRSFTTVVRQQIELMRTPSLKCVDAVYTELEDIVRKSTKSIGPFPKLTDIYTHITLNFLRECKKKCKESVEQKMDTEKAYINTNNEEFIRSVQSDMDCSDFPLAKLLLNQKCVDPIKKGKMRVNGTERYVTLEDSTLFFYKDKFKGNPEGTFNLKMAKIICGNNFILLKCNKSKIRLDFKSKDKTIEWIYAMIDRTDFNGTVDEDNPFELKIPKNESEDNEDCPQGGRYAIKMEEQVEQVLDLVVHYVKMIEKNLKDTLPKLCQKELIDSTEQFIAVKLRGQVQSKELTIDDLIDVDPMEAERKNLVHVKYQLEEALQTMNEVLMTSN